MRALVLLLWLGACRPAPPDTPVASYLAFLSAVHEGDAAAAYDRLSTPTRQKLEARTRAVAEALGDAGTPGASDQVFAPVQPSAMPTEVKQVRLEGDVAELEVVQDGGSSPVRMVHEPGGWKVDLSAALK